MTRLLAVVAIAVAVSSAASEDPGWLWGDPDNVHKNPPTQPLRNARPPLIPTEYVELPDGTRILASEYVEVHIDANTKAIYSYGKPTGHLTTGGQTMFGTAKDLARALGPKFGSLVRCLGSACVFGISMAFAVMELTAGAQELGDAEWSNEWIWTGTYSDYGTQEWFDYNTRRTYSMPDPHDGGDNGIGAAISAGGGPAYDSDQMGLLQRWFGAKQTRLPRLNIRGWQRVMQMHPWDTDLQEKERAWHIRRQVFVEDGEAVATVLSAHGYEDWRHCQSVCLRYWGGFSLGYRTAILQGRPTPVIRTPDYYGVLIRLYATGDRFIAQPSGCNWTPPESITEMSSLLFSAATIDALERLVDEAFKELPTSEWIPRESPPDVYPIGQQDSSVFLRNDTGRPVAVNYAIHTETQRYPLESMLIPPGVTQHDIDWPADGSTWQTVIHYPQHSSACAETIGGRSCGIPSYFQERQ